jgi:hypothetical protein
MRPNTDQAIIEILDQGGTDWAIEVDRDTSGAPVRLTLRLNKRAEIMQFAEGFRWLADRLEQALELADSWRGSSKIEREVNPDQTGGDNAASG